MYVYVYNYIPSGKLSHNYGKSPPFFMGKLTISMANSYVSHNQRVQCVCVCFLPRPSRWGFPSSWHFRPALCSTAARPRASSMLPRPELSAFSKAPLTAPLTAHDGNTAVDNTLKSYYLIISNIIHFNNSDDFDIIHFRSFYQQQTALLYHYCT